MLLMKAVFVGVCVCECASECVCVKSECVWKAFIGTLCGEVVRVNAVSIC